MGTSAESRQYVCFGEFELDLSTGELRTTGRTQYLSEQPFQILSVLLGRPGQLVTRDEIKKRLWPTDTFVDFDHGLNRAMNRLREALEDSSERPRFIETLPRRGYRFIAPVTIEHHREPVTTAAPSPSPSVLEWPTDPARTEPLNSVLESATAASSPRQIAGRNWKLLTGILVAVFAVIATLGIVVVRWRSRNHSFNLENMEITKLTQSGKAESVAISPDGHFVVYAQRDAQGLGLWLRQVATRSDVQILPPEPIEFEGLSFSPDSNYIYFVRSAKKLTDFRFLYTMPVLGGSVRLVASDIDSPVSFSPDGRQFAYTRGDASRDLCEIRIANTDGSSNHILATIPKAFPDYQPGAAWSPDGRTIAVSFMLKGQQLGYVLKLVSIRDGSIGELYSNSYGIGRPLWLPEGNAMLVSLRDRARRGQLWKVSFPQGQAHRLTNDLADYGLRIDATRNVGTVATIQATTVSNVWVAPAADFSGGRQITFGEIPLFRVATAQGKILATSGDELLIMNADGSQTTSVSNAHNGYYPAACGRYFLFSSFQPGKTGLTRLDADGSNLTILVANGLIVYPVCSPDNQSVFYVDWPSKILRVPVEGGTPTEIATGLGNSIDGQLSISPDGKFLAYGFEEITPEPASKLAVIPVDGRSPTKVLQAPGWTYERACLRWSPDGEGLESLVTRDGVTNIWEQPLAGGHPRQLTRFTSGRIFDFNWSPDGKQLFLTRGDTSSDVVLLSNFR